MTSDTVGFVVSVTDGDGVVSTSVFSVTSGAVIKKSFQAKMLVSTFLQYSSALNCSILSKTVVLL